MNERGPPVDDTTAAFSGVDPRDGKGCLYLESNRGTATTIVMQTKRR